MKGLPNISLVLLLFLGCLLSSCRDVIFDRVDDSCPAGGIVINLEPTGFSEHSMFRSVTTDDGAIASGFLAVYDKGSGNRIYYKSKNQAPQWSDDLGSVNASGLIVYAIANYDQNVGYNNIPNMTDLENASNLSKLKQLLSREITPVSQFREDGLMLMQAYEVFDNLTPSADTRITESGGKLHLKVVLKRMESKIDFTIKMGKGAKGSFYPRVWRICNIPNKKKLYQDSKEYNPYVSENDFFSPAEKNWANFEQSDEPDSVIANTFSVIIPANRLAPQKMITPDAYSEMTGKTVTSLNPAQEFKMRAHREKIGTLEESSTPPPNIKNGDFDYAPKKVTYIEIVGNYKNENGTRLANVKYTIPLGYGGDYIAPDGETVIKKVDNYCVDPNGHYTINARVHSVDDIVAEVVENNSEPINDHEFDTHQEGDVLDNLHKDNTKLLDAHYGSFILRVKRSDLFYNRNQRKPIDYNVFTPFDGPDFPVPSGSSFKPGKRDIKWVKFVLIKRLGKFYYPPGNYYPYLLPGGHYSEGDKHPTMEEQANSWNANRIQKYQDLTKDGFLYVNDLVKVLKEIPYDSDLWKRGYKEDGSCPTDEEVLMFGGLVYEYYYDETFFRDLDNNLLSNLFGDNIKMWKERGWTHIVNQPDRVMNLYLGGNNLISADHKSTYVERPYFSIRQRSIKTTNTTIGFFHYATTEGSYNFPFKIEGFETIDEKYTERNLWVGNPQVESWLIYHDSNVNSSEGLNKNPYANKGSDWESYKKNYNQGYIASLAMWGLTDKDSPNPYTFKNHPRWDTYRWIEQDYYRPKPGSYDNNQTASAEFNCLSRNMDLNGNGIIDEDEVRWYTPSYMQFIRMKMVDPFLPAEERLLSPDGCGGYSRFVYGGAKMNIPQIPYFFTTTSPGFSKGKYYMVVNGGSGNESYFVENSPWAKEDGNHGWGVSVRCVRNLGQSPNLGNLNAYNESYLDDAIKIRLLCNSSPWLFKIDKKGGDYITTVTSSYPMAEGLNEQQKTKWKENVGIYIDLRNITSSFLRHTFIPEGELPRTGGAGYLLDHSIFDKPYYKGFRLAAMTLSLNDQSGGSTVNQRLTDWYNHTTHYNCGNYSEKWTVNDKVYTVKGWRMPSQTELLYMIAYIPWTKFEFTVKTPTYETKNQNVRGWINRNNSSYFADIMSASVNAKNRVYILHDTGKDGFIQLQTQEDIANFKAAVRCVRDWDPDKGLVSDDGTTTLTKAQMEQYIQY